MRWLNALLRKERGASAVVFGLLLVPLMGALAISVDVGGLYAEKAQLQNGADAAALAVAYECAIDDDCTGSSTIASSYAASNAIDDSSTSLQPTFPAAGTVRVDVETENSDGTDELRHPFAAVLGIDSTKVVADATAIWGPPVSGSVFPLALSYCDFADSEFEETVFIRIDENKTCSGPQGEPIAGGFGWLDEVSGECLAEVDLAEATMPGAPGLSISQACRDALQELEGEVVLLPIYKCNQDPNDNDCSNGIQGQNGVFEIYSFASFLITGWVFPGETNPDPNAPECSGGSAPTPGNGNGNGNGNGSGNGNGNGDPNGNNCMGIQGQFVEWVGFSDLDVDPNGVNLGTTVIKLID
jgi:Flp pilus assembly protein TadG